MISASHLTFPKKLYIFLIKLKYIFFYTTEGFNQSYNNYVILYVFRAQHTWNTAPLLTGNRFIVTEKVQNIETESHGPVSYHYYNFKLDDNKKMNKTMGNQYQ